MSKVNLELTKLLHPLYGENWSVYGPYISNQDGRKRIVMSDGTKKKTRQLAKVLLEIKLGRLLIDDETVDHIDEDKTNDDIGNLQLLSKSKNSSKSALKVIYPIVNCVWCNSEFRLKAGQMRKESGPFCSNKCSGSFGAAKQNGRSEILRNEIGFKIYHF